MLQSKALFKFNPRKSKTALVNRKLDAILSQVSLLKKGEFVHMDISEIKRYRAAARVCPAAIERRAF